METQKSEEWEDKSVYPWWMVPEGTVTQVLMIEEDRGDKE